MLRLRRYFSLALAIFFSLLTLLLAALWIDSYIAQEKETLTLLSRHHMHWTTESSEYLNTHSLHSFPGYMMFCRFHDFKDSAGAPPPNEPNVHFLGFEWMYIEALDSYSLWVVVPHWQPVLLCALISASTLLIRVVRRRRKKKRLSTHLCPNCSYDLRMHHPGDKCPECGTPVSSPVSSSSSSSSS